MSEGDKIAARRGRPSAAQVRPEPVEIVPESEADRPVTQVTPEPEPVKAAVEYPGMDSEICARCGYLKSGMMNRCRVCANQRR